MAAEAVDSDLFTGPGSFTNTHGQIITFYWEAVEDALASRGGIRRDPLTGEEERVVGAGRPIYKDVEYIEIKTPGDPTSIPRRPVSDKDRRQYARQYEAWKAKEAMPDAGTPLMHWPGVRKSEVAELAAIGIKTVEALAAVTDGNLQNLGMAKRELRDRAKVWLDAAKGNAPLEALQAQLRARDAEMEALKRQMAELVAAKGQGGVNAQQQNKR